MMKPLVILGAGGFARETLDIVDAINALAPTWNMLGFIVDEAYEEAGKLIHQQPILGGFGWLTKNRTVSVVCGVGSPEIRAQMISRVPSELEFAVLIHPSVISSRWVKIGRGTIIAAGCILTNEISIGEHVHINLDCTVGHDVIIEDFATISPGAHISGNVRIETGVSIGTGANIIEKVKIGEWTTVGAGSTVIQSIPANTTAVGVPARVIKERTAGWHLSI